MVFKTQKMVTKIFRFVNNKNKTKYCDVCMSISIEDIKNKKKHKKKICN